MLLAPTRNAALDESGIRERFELPAGWAARPEVTLQVAHAEGLPVSREVAPADVPNNDEPRPIPP
jgi:hypothetical protein